MDGSDVLLTSLNDMTIQGSQSVVMMSIFSAWRAMKWIANCMRLWIELLGWFRRIHGKFRKCLCFCMLVPFRRCYTYSMAINRLFYQKNLVCMFPLYQDCWCSGITNFVHFDAQILCMRLPFLVTNLLMIWHCIPLNVADSDDDLVGVCAVYHSSKSGFIMPIVKFRGLCIIAQIINRSERSLRLLFGCCSLLNQPILGTHAYQAFSIVRWNRSTTRRLWSRALRAATRHRPFLPTAPTADRPRCTTCGCALSVTSPRSVSIVAHACVCGCDRSVDSPRPLPSIMCTTWSCVWHGFSLFVSHSSVVCSFQITFYSHRFVTDCVLHSV